MKRLLATLALVLVAGAAHAQSSVVIRDANQLSRNIRAFALPDGSLAPGHVVTSPITGLPYGMLNGQPVAPAIAAGYPVDHSGTIAAAGVSQQVMASNSNRKTGFIQSDPRNTDILAISVTGAASTAPGAPAFCIITPGGTCPLMVDGYVVQAAVTITSATSGLAYSATEVQ